MFGMLFSLAAYLVFNILALALLLFVGDLWLPHTVDRGLWSADPWLAAGIDIVLLAQFGLQHSVMARSGFKHMLTKLVPPHLERSVYVMAASIALALLIGLWHPIPLVLWDAADPAVAGFLWLLFGAGWLLIMASTYMIDHFELFGVAQAFRHWRRLPRPADTFRIPYLYRHVRHPLYLGCVIAFWATPQMTVGHLLFAGGMTAYIMIGIAFEERDLIRQFGEAYRTYRSKVPALIPLFKPYRQN